MERSCDWSHGYEILSSDSNSLNLSFLFCTMETIIFLRVDARVNGTKLPPIVYHISLIPRCTIFHILTSFTTVMNLVINGMLSSN